MSFLEDSNLTFQHLSILLLILFVLYIFIFIRIQPRLKGSIDFSLKKTRFNLIESIIWVLIIWFVVPILILWFLRIDIDYLSYREMKEILQWKIGITLVLTSPIWTNWILKPLYYWIKKGKGD